jgi:nitrogen regulatory protein P-II 2
LRLQLRVDYFPAAALSGDLPRSSAAAKFLEVSTGTTAAKTQNQSCLLGCRLLVGFASIYRAQRAECGVTENMKLIIAIIQPSKLEAVKAALTDVEVFRLTVMDCQGFGRQKGQTEVYRGHEFSVNLLRKVQLQIAVNEEFVEPTVNAIIQGGRTGEKGEIGDGKIFVLPLDDCIRIRTGERGVEAI